MSCFIVPMTQAIVTTVLRKTIKNRPENPWISQLPKLEMMLWGGSLMLVVDHILNGELTYQFPFFTALSQVGGVHTMLREMLCVGLPMSVAITVVYLVFVLLSYRNPSFSVK